MVPPGPIPNPEVKHWRVDDSRTIGPAKVDRRQDQTQPAALTALRAAPFHTPPRCCLWVVSWMGMEEILLGRK